MLVTNPWFWAFLAMFGWFLGLLVVGSGTFGRRHWFGWICITLVEVPRFLLPLPFVTQPRLAQTGPFMLGLGAVILVVSLTFCSAALRIRPQTGPNRDEPLRTDGLYAIVRHPVMLCDSFWPLGWSLIWGSVVGALLTAFWFVSAYLLTFLEEENLLEQYGEAYARYRQAVPRILPFVKWL